MVKGTLRKRSPRVRLRSIRWLSTFAVCLCALPCVTAAGNKKLWELGDDVEANPVTVFTMFCVVVLLTIGVEKIKHYAEHNTTDPDRHKGLEAIIVEIMLVGVVSFLLVLSAELGLTDVKIKWFCDEGSGSGSVTATTGSATGSAATTTGSAGTATGTGSAATDTGSAAGTAASGTGTAAPSTTAYPSISPSVSPKKKETYAPTGKTTVAPSTPVAATTASASGSGSECGYGFDLLMFEYAHLVLFWMGLTYCAFIQIGFAMRDGYSRDILVMQQYNLPSWCEVAHRLPVLANKFGMRVVAIRSAVCIEHKPLLEAICDPYEYAHEHALSTYQGNPRPSPFPAQDVCVNHFNMGKFMRIEFSAFLVKVMHVPNWVWLTVMVMSLTNVVHRAGVSLATCVILSGFLTPLFAGIVWWRLNVKFAKLAKAALGHPDYDGVKWHAALPHPESHPWEPVPTFKDTGGLEWSEGGPSPWEQIEALGKNAWMAPGEKTYLGIIQVSVFATCFYVGQLVMLSNLILDTLGLFGWLGAWVLPCFPLLFFIPRAMLSYTLIYLTHKPSRPVLRRTMQILEQTVGAGGHGHSAHAHDDGPLVDYGYNDNAADRNDKAYKHPGNVGKDPFSNARKIRNESSLSNGWDKDVSEISIAVPSGPLSPNIQQATRSSSNARGGASARPLQAKQAPRRRGGGGMSSNRGGRAGHRMSYTASSPTQQSGFALPISYELPPQQQFTS
eukprot:Hpha_TRINITY_DN1797_c0_g1::TRINITY_DN1797_c0_g1_i1::g.158421::m.158421